MEQNTHHGFGHYDLKLYTVTKNISCMLLFWSNVDIFHCALHNYRASLFSLTAVILIYKTSLFEAGRSQL